MSDEQVFAVDVVGMDRWCPYCRRQLLWIQPDGGVTLAPRSGTHMRTEIPFDPETGRADEDAATTIAVDARCLLWRCRLRAWWEARR